VQKLNNCVLEKYKNKVKLDVRKREHTILFVCKVKNDAFVDTEISSLSKIRIFRIFVQITNIREENYTCVNLPSHAVRIQS